MDIINLSAPVAIPFLNLKFGECFYLVGGDNLGPCIKINPKNQLNQYTNLFVILKTGELCHCAQEAAVYVINGNFQIFSPKL